MAEFKINQFKYTWRGDWVAGTIYRRDDIIKYGGSSWACIRVHTSQINFYDDLEFTIPGETVPSPSWVQITGGFSFVGEWQPDTRYNVDDVVLYSGVLYLCDESFVSTDLFDDNIANFNVYADTQSFQNNWTEDTRYGIGAVVVYNGIVYRCTQGHTSEEPGSSIGEVPSLLVDLDKWEILNEGVQFRGDWQSLQTYRKNDLVQYGGTVWRCKKEYVSAVDSTVFFTEEENWDIEFPGFKYAAIPGIDSTIITDAVWQPEITYSQGDVVKHGGYLFYALTSSYGSVPTDSIYQITDQEDPAKWKILTEGTNFRGEWTATTLNQFGETVPQTYKIGDVVTRGGNLYIAKLDSTVDGSSLDYLDDSNWELLNQGFNWRGNWDQDLAYSAGDVVKFLGSTYRSNIAHISSSENFPGDNGSGFFYWDVILQSASQIGMNERGDLLTYNLSRGLAGDTSTVGPARVPKGSNGQILLASDSQEVEYGSWGAIQRVFHVSPDGIDDPFDPERGINPFSPWKTIRYACERADDGFAGTTTIDVTTGRYVEILPIIVPARTVILGDELRSTTILPNQPIAYLQNTAYTISMLFRLYSIIETLIAGNRVTKTLTNLENQVFLTNNEVFPPIAITGSGAAGSAIKSLIENVEDYINFYVNSAGDDPAVIGTNVAVTDTGFTNAVLILEANKEFLVAEAVAFLQQQNPEIVFDLESFKRDIRYYIDAWKYDIIYTGNYKTLLAARYFRNAVLGSASEDMFYCRDTTGVRNCTLTGLVGALNPPNVNDLYRLPTGGAFVSLDPGWGPADTRTWITNRSPYIQGVTTIGTGCIGQKVDGLLHNGGNKSITSNDFTQVLSDGVGAWILNGGRAELVSVFTYYCHVGYLASNGGIMRATNGNCSYGKFGAIADGIDDSETPAIAAVNNRTQEATVVSAFAGEFVDEIQILEWNNSGERYTSATGTVTGAGVGASILFEDFRDDAVFQCRLLDNTPTQINQNIGGGGYSIQQNSAQVHQTPGGDALGITIASNDDNSITQYGGKRIIIVSGSGTGQYGYITAYNTTTKVVSVSRESDGQPGWDHVVSGTPIKIPLDTTTVYRIEPRPIFPSPGFIATSKAITDVDAWSCIAYGETVESFGNVSSELGTGTVIPDDGLVPVIAEFNVTKTGRSYTAVTLASGAAGAGYAEGDILTLLGTDLGGFSPAHDITVTVTGISNDSTNSITTFTYTGNAGSGQFVALASGGTVAAYSRDGEIWDSAELPSSGNWKAVAAGNNRFVAIVRGSSAAASSTNGVAWTPRSMPTSRNWEAVAYGNGRFVAVASSGNNLRAAYSTNGTSWTSAAVPTIGDSSLNELIDITYGKGKFVALANSQNVVLESNNGGVSWVGHIMDSVNDSSQKDWVSIAYGNNRFVAISSTGDISYSFDAETWVGATMPSQDGSTAHYWRKIRYAQGVFIAVGDTGGRDIGADPVPTDSRFAVTSSDGLIWTARELPSSELWVDVAFGNPYVEAQDSSVGKNSTMWIALASNSNNTCKIKTGATALARVEVASGKVNRVKLWNPGSGYLEPPIMTVIDPSSTSAVLVEARVGDGVLAEPSWLNRGVGYRTRSTVVTITGDGFGDNIPVGKFVTITNLNKYPGPGGQITFVGNPQIYTIVAITELGGPIDNLSAIFRVSPELKSRDKLEHNTSVEIRERYSQCRITGHDFLDIGTGNFLETNYPELYSGLYQSAPEDEIREEQGGRVFYTSTDQSGNFRCGELFAVEQATGIVTISADFFDLSGLTELRLGGIRIGGSGVVVREFSTDPLFTEDSNNIVPTQRAISRYLANRLSVGGAEIATASFIAGTVLVGPDKIASTVSGIINIPVIANFSGANAGVSGSMLAQTMFYRSFG
jgi:hypothetical protein